MINTKVSEKADQVKTFVSDKLTDLFNVDDNSTVGKIIKEVSSTLIGIVLNPIQDKITTTI